MIQVMGALAVARKDMLDMTWPRDIGVGHLMHALRLLQGGSRGRLGSMWGAVARHPLHYAESLLPRLSAKTKAALSEASMHRVMKANVDKFRKEVIALQAAPNGLLNNSSAQLMDVFCLDVFKSQFADYKATKGLKWFLWCYFVVRQELGGKRMDDLWLAQKREVAHGAEALPSLQTLKAIGTFDCHTGDGSKADFYHIGCHVVNPLQGVDYQEWDEAYAACSMAKSEADEAAKKAAKQAERLAKKRKAEEDAANKRPAAQAELELLGFKNLTLLVRSPQASLQALLPPLPQLSQLAEIDMHSPLYFKYGEDQDTNLYHVACTRLVQVPQLIGQQSVCLRLKEGVNALPLMQELLQPAHAPDKWKQSAQSNLNKKYNLGKRHVLIEQAFGPEWLRLSDVYKSKLQLQCLLADDDFLHSLLCNLLFSVFVGKGDINAFNLMVRLRTQNAPAAVRSVDWGPQKDTAKLQLYAAPCLVPCQTQRDDVKQKLVDYICRKPQAVAAFIEQELLTLLPLPPDVIRGRYLGPIHSSFRKLSRDLQEQQAALQPLAQALFCKPPAKRKRD
jgi:hypothetical protein